VCNADLNEDGTVDPRDLRLMIEVLGDAGVAPPGYDLNCDGVLDPCDLGIYECAYQNAGACCSGSCWACTIDVDGGEACIMTTRAWCVGAQTNGTYQGDGSEC
jgi:hypothetical protein